MGTSEPLYQAAVARAILEVAAEGMIGDIFRIDEHGVWIDAPVGEFGNWHPAMEINEPGSPDPLSEPSLPFPFTARQLAAFALSGMGSFVSECFFGDGPYFWTGEGPWGHSVEQRDEMLGRLPRRGIKAREALLEAHKAYDAAAALVRPPDVGLGVERRQEDERDRRELARWRRDMCRALLRPQASPSHRSANSGRASSVSENNHETKGELSELMSTLGRRGADATHARSRAAKAKAISIYAAGHWTTVIAASESIAVEVKKAPTTVKKWLEAYRRDKHVVR